jgi:hypothetical protein
MRAGWYETGLYETGLYKNWIIWGFRTGSCEDWGYIMGFTVLYKDWDWVIGANYEDWVTMNGYMKTGLLGLLGLYEDWVVWGLANMRTGLYDAELYEDWCISELARLWALR